MASSTIPKHKRSLAQQKATVETPGLDQMEMAARVELSVDLLGGTRVMREKCEQWLPREEKEKLPHYKERVERSFLYPALEDTIDKVGAKPFEHPVTANADELPTLLQPFVDNTDLRGTDLNAFAKASFRDGLTHGITHILVNQSVNPGQSADTSIRPNFVLLSQSDILAVRYEDGDDGGTQILAYLRYRHTRVEGLPDNDFGQIRRTYIREMTRTELRDFSQEKEGAEFKPDDWIPHTFRSTVGGAIPLVTIYFEADGQMLARPPFAKLAEINLEHFQKSSDHTNLSRFAAVGTMVLAGFRDVDEDGNPKKFVLGPRNTLKSESSDANASIVEHSGSALAILSDGILRLEERMEVLGLEPFMRKTGSETATGKALHVGKSDSAIKGWIGAEEAGLLQAFRLAGEWLSKISGGQSDIEVPADWKPRLYSDFKVPVLKGTDDTQHLLSMRSAREIDHQTYIEETVRRGTLSEDTDFEAIQERLEAEADAPEMPPPSSAVDAPEPADDESSEEAQDRGQ
jgi:hypothetical protein